MLTRSTLSRLCIVGAASSRQPLTSCITAAGAENFLPQQAISLCDSSSSSALTTNHVRSASSSPGSHIYDSSRFTKDFRLIDYLGRGSYGIVCAALNTLDMQTYAIKCIPFGQQTPELLNEVRAMARLPPHANVIRYFSSWMENSTISFRALLDVFVKRDIGLTSSSAPSSLSTLSGNFRDASQVLYIQMEYCHGSLRSWLQTRMEVDPPRSINIFNQMVNGLRHLHSNGLLHLDIKPENCLHNDKQIFKISDFGSSRVSDQPALGISSTFVGTESYAAPECKTGSQNCSTQSDVFSLGLCLMELFTAFTTGMERVLAFDCIRKRMFTDNWMIKWPNVATIIKAMTMPNPADRPSIDHLLEWSSSLLKPDPTFAICDVSEIEDCPEDK